ncbi:phage tail tape measure protein [Pseudogulbenkiania sp. MAI-1]|uniref:phage tail tape measure protein n=1 Tax=Pseudogulbenkiania sp. MAI-1 TaxID=990370 RepID=UPI00045E95F2|nr:phage tail tape measure protein [Pseudogulbenkiania sp. MAI-1]
MSRNLDLALTLRARDEMSRPVARAMQQLAQESQKAVAASKNAGQASAEAGQAGARSFRQLAQESQKAGATMLATGRATVATAQAGAASLRTMTTEVQRGERAMIGLSRESQRMTSAREQLGVRAEQAIQREIRQTEAAYQRLTRSGALSANEQARAYAAMRQRVRELREEMSGVSRLQRGMASSAKGLVAGAAGVTAAKYVVSQPLQRVEDYDLRLRYMANTAYAEQGLGGRRAGLREMREAIAKSVRNGGNRDQAADTLNNMIASGALGEGAQGRQSALALLPTVMKYATAAEADPNAIADIVLKSKKTLKIADADFPKVLEMAMLGGKLGGFELKDMAKWLPQQMAAASSAGMSGTNGLAKLVALNQNAVVTAGTKDEAGNNVVNFLAKLNAEETSKDFKKVGINWRQKLVDGTKQGKDAVDVFGDAIDGLLKKNAAYQKLQAKLATATGEEKKATLDSMARIVQGSVVGNISSDRQELMAVIAMLNDRAGMADIEQKLRAVKPGEVVNTDLSLIQESAAWKGQQGENTMAEKEFNALSGLSSTVGDVKLKLVEYADKYPALSTALVGTTTALTALAAAAGAAGLASMMTGGGGSLATRAASGAGALLRGATAAGTRLLPVAAAGAAGYGIGTAINAGITGVLTATNGGKERTFGTWLYDLVNGSREAKLLAPTPLPRRNEPSAAAPIPQLSLLQSAVTASTRLDLAAKTMQQAVSQPIPVKVTVDVKNGNIVAAVNATNSATARRY